MGKKLTTKEFIKRSKSIHGTKYNYFKSVYINYPTKIIIICKIHGKFLQTPYEHYHGHGCPNCKKETLSNLYKYNTKEFIDKAKKIHGAKYDYSKIRYVDCRTKIIILCCSCKKSFNQIPNDHLQGHGCPFCIGRNKTSSDIKNILKKNRGNKYNYNKINFKNNRTKIEIICKKHGSFWQTLHNHLNGTECPKCNSRSFSKNELIFLDYLKIPDNKKSRQFLILNKKVDGFDPKTNTVYEFLGDYWHGNPKIFNPNHINKRCKQSFKNLYNKTISRFIELKENGYNIKYIWESDWKIFMKNPDKKLLVQTFD